MKKKTEQKIQAILLRKKGYSLNEIVARLGVAKSSASLWVRNVPLSLQARALLAKKIGEGRLRGAETRRHVSVAGWSVAREQAKEVYGSFVSNKTSDVVICSLLYYCEGAKGVGGGVRFTNSNVALMTRFIDLFKKCFIIDRRRMRMGLHLHEYHGVAAQRTYWSKATGIPEKQFIRPYQKPHTGKRIRDNYPGCATFYYSDTTLARNLIAIAEQYLGA